MVRRVVKSNLSPFSQQRCNHVCVKFAASFFLVVFAVCILLWDSYSFSILVMVEETQKPPPLKESNVKYSSHDGAEKCNLFVGEWVEELTGPVYNNENCDVIQPYQNCMKNGRPDSGYLYWRWKPRDCELPKFNPNKFLSFMRNKAMAFVGDSISRNHVESLLCILLQVEPAIEVYHNKEYRSKKWKFLSHNFTLSVIWAPFLVKAAIINNMNEEVSTSEIQLYLDTLNHQWTNQFKDFNYVIIGGGKWFLAPAIYHEKNTIIGSHYFPEKNLTQLGFDYAYHKALQMVFNFLTNSSHNATVLFRTTSPDHFENGEWNSGGYCNRSIPFKEGQVDLVSVDSIMHGIELEEFYKASSLGYENGVKLKLLDVTFLSLLRPDGHPGPYRLPYTKDKNAKVQNDCLHWCLPGPIDSWNDIVMEILVNSS